MKKMKKTNEVIDELLKRDGWWPCKYCSNQNWKIHHKPEETTCPCNNKPREDAEMKDIRSNDVSRS